MKKLIKLYHCEDCEKECNTKSVIFLICEFCNSDQIFDKFDGGWPCKECGEEETAHFNSFCSEQCEEKYKRENINDLEN